MTCLPKKEITTLIYIPTQNLFPSCSAYRYCFIISATLHTYFSGFPVFRFPSSISTLLATRRDRFTLWSSVSVVSIFRRSPIVRSNRPNRILDEHHNRVQWMSSSIQLDFFSPAIRIFFSSFQSQTSWPSYFFSRLSKRYRRAYKMENKNVHQYGGKRTCAEPERPRRIRRRNWTRSRWLTASRTRRRRDPFR